MSCEQLFANNCPANNCTRTSVRIPLIPLILASGFTVWLDIAPICYSFSSAVPPFKSDLISEAVLQRLMKQNIVVNFRLIDPTLSDCFLYKNGKPCDYFIMILQGRVLVEFGKENLIFEGGPFAFFGVQALGNCTDDVFFSSGAALCVTLLEG